MTYSLLVDVFFFFLDQWLPGGSAAIRSVVMIQGNAMLDYENIYSICIIYLETRLNYILFFLTKNCTYSVVTFLQLHSHFWQARWCTDKFLFSFFLSFYSKRIQKWTPCLIADVIQECITCRNDHGQQTDKYLYYYWTN